MWAGPFTVLVTPFRTTEVATVFERIMMCSFRSILGGDVDAWSGAGDTDDVNAVDRAVAGQGDAPAVPARMVPVGKVDVPAPNRAA